LSGKALIIGGGIAGLSAAMELSQRGIEAHVVESKPAIGGHAASYCCKATDRCHKCYACLVTQRISQVKSDPEIKLHPTCEVTAIQYVEKGVSASIFQNPQYIDMEKCISCGLCDQECPQNCIGTANPNSTPREYIMDIARCLNSLGKSCDICEKKCPVDAIDLNCGPVTTQIDADAVVVATGFVPYDPIQKGTFGYGEFPNVISAIDLESTLAQDGTAGLKLPSNGEIAKEVAFIQCVGSRYDKVEDDSHTNIYCSRVCCGYALRMANLIIDRAPETKITVFFMDLQHFGKNFDEFVDKCSHNPNFEFMRGIPAKAAARNGNIELVYEDFAHGGVKSKSFDAVVLSVGMRPSPNNRLLAGMLDIGLDKFGFFAGGRNGSLVTTAKERVFRVGTCLGPKDIGECLNEASAAAGEIADLIERQ
jgi:heterodisulfide reductase subunit A2